MTAATTPMTRLRLVPPYQPRRHCAVCGLPLPATARPEHSLCRTCWRWCAAGTALHKAAEALREPRP